MAGARKLRRGHVMLAWTTLGISVLVSFFFLLVLPWLPLLPCFELLLNMFEYACLCCLLLFLFFSLTLRNVNFSPVMNISEGVVFWLELGFCEA